LLYSKTLTKGRNQKDGNYPLTLEASLEVLADAKIINQHLDAAAMMQKAYWEKGCACTSCPVLILLT